MADGPLHEERTGGIFIPYDKLLQQQSDKLDKILDELRELGRVKLDVTVFDSFRSAYEQKYEVLATGVRDYTVSRDRWVPVIQEHADAIKTLNYLAGGGLVGLLVIVNLAVNAWQLLH